VLVRLASEENLCSTDSVTSQPKRHELDQACDRARAGVRRVTLRHHPRHHHRRYEHDAETEHFVALDADLDECRDLEISNERTHRPRHGYECNENEVVCYKLRVLASLAQASIKVGEVVIIAGALAGRVHGVTHDALGRS
jgi:hypothetical protein